MFKISIIVKLALVFSFNSLDASVKNITNIINDINHSIDDIKNKYILIKHDIFSPKNSVSTNYSTYSYSLTTISSQLSASRYEIFEKLLNLDIEQKHIDKISKIKLKSELLNNAICVLQSINKYHISYDKNNHNSFEDYKIQVKRLASYENFLSQIE